MLDARSQIADPSNPGNLVPNPDFNQYLSKIPVSGTPLYVAPTHDDSRAYATLVGGGVQAIDVDSLQATDLIPLPAGATPFEITIDQDDKYAYVTDNNSGSIYVIDIDPNSNTYDTLVHTISVTSVIDGGRDQGLRGLALNSDGTRLFVAAPTSALFLRPSSESGRILVVDTSNPKSKTYWTQVDSITAGPSPFGVAATPYPDKMVYTDYVSDSVGFNVLSGTVDGLRTVTSLALNLSKNPFSPFDVNNARAVAITPDGSYAFVAGWDSEDPDIPSHDQYYPGDDPAGSNIGIIKDPFGADAVLVGATALGPGRLPARPGRLSGRQLSLCVVSRVRGDLRLQHPRHQRGGQRSQQRVSPHPPRHRRLHRWCAWPVQRRDRHPGSVRARQGIVDVRQPRLQGV